MKKLYVLIICFLFIGCYNSFVTIEPSVKYISKTFHKSKTIVSLDIRDTKLMEYYKSPVIHMRLEPIDSERLLNTMNQEKEIKLKITIYFYDDYFEVYYDTTGTGFTYRILTEEIYYDGKPVVKEEGKPELPEDIIEDINNFEKEETY